MKIPCLALLAALLPSLVIAQNLPPDGSSAASTTVGRRQTQWSLGLDRLYGTESRSPDFFGDTVEPDSGFPAGGLEPGRTLELPGISERLKEDLRALVMTPLTARRRGWKRLGAGVALVGVVSVFDDEIRSFASPGSRGTATTGQLRPLGQEASIAVLGGAWLIGKATGKERYKNIARDGLEASILAAGFMAPLGKSLIGRDRPRDAGGLSTSPASNSSFPSGEATQLFAIASVISAHSDRRWVKALTWGLAGGVAWQRLEMDAHWASDVTAGALLGSAVGRWVVRRHRPEREDRSSWSISPQAGDGAAGLALRWSR